jgi:hypothetical protein
MNREQAKALLPVIVAFSEGRAIECRSAHHGPANDGWTQAKWIPDLEGGMEYRIKPEPKWRPWRPDEVPTYFMSQDKLSGFFMASNQRDFLNKSDCAVLFQNRQHLHEDGTTTPCGVLEP